MGIDPSFTRTGLALLKLDPVTSEVLVVDTCSISAPTFSGDKYQLEFTMQGADWIARQSLKKIKAWHKMYPVTLGVVEYPVLATRSGSYLGLIQQALYMLYPWLDVNFIGVPSNAIKSISKYKSKSDLVEWSKSKFNFACETHRRGKWCINHDECSAIALAYIGTLIRMGKYKNSSKQFYSK